MTLSDVGLLFVERYKKEGVEHALLNTLHPGRALSLVRYFEVFHEENFENDRMLEFVVRLVASNAVTALLFAIFVLLLWMTLSTGRSGPTSPPGPWANAIPVVGYLPFLRGRPMHEVLAELSSKYGKLFRVRLGCRWMVVISCPQLYRKTFQREDMTGLCHIDVIDNLTEGHGITTSEGQLWKVHRHFTMAALRDLGMLRSNSANRDQFKAVIASSIDVFLKEVDSHNGEPVDLTDPLSFTVANVFFFIVISKTYDRHDPEIKTSLAEIHDSFKVLESIGVVNFLPFLQHLPSIKKGLKTLFSRRDGARDFFDEIIKEHRATLDPSNPRDFIDAFLIQMDEQTPTFTEKQLKAVLADLYSAGVGTTVASLRWLFLLLAKNPHIQKKVQKELNDVVGDSRRPSLEDRPHLPYMEAVIREILRISSILSLGAPHCPKQDVIVENYHIPKGTLICGLLWKFHHDPTLWKNGSDFNPDNFLDENGIPVKHDCFMPFSYGRRSCIGEEIARQEIFLIAASLLQSYTLLPPDGEILPSIEDTASVLVRTPVPYKLKVQKTLK